ncbi:hypothetical protein R69658_02678 [Paraburkholderia aspalathi]|uniref:Uncharacterized protein n=1 Tax=Paraburkholderia aspalathi TaxID=1324617 RepID=A0ABN7LJF4_9BURK|nr:hypothetical protein R69658_02678 [Paraburkholderia aspalathi]CAE6776713.1 hypothetical protein R69746_04103 [Paraburkholderia aspalathi]
MMDRQQQTAFAAQSDVRRFDQASGFDIEALLQRRADREQTLGPLRGLGASVDIDHVEQRGGVRHRSGCLHLLLPAVSVTEEFEAQRIVRDDDRVQRLGD